jgi:putative phosphoesterase
MKVGIITDTHDCQKVLIKAVEVFEEHGVVYILHAGDITSPATAEALANIDHTRLIAVFGNCDYDSISLENAINRQEGEIHRGVCRREIGEKKLLMAHDPRALGDAATTGDYDLVVYGHTHKHDIHRASKTLVVNPGQFRAVILELDTMEYEVISLK